MRLSSLIEAGVPRIPAPRPPNVRPEWNRATCLLGDTFEAEGRGDLALPYYEQGSCHAEIAARDLARDPFDLLVRIKKHEDGLGSGALDVRALLALGRTELASRELGWKEDRCEWDWTIECSLHAGLRARIGPRELTESAAEPLTGWAMTLIGPVSSSSSVRTASASGARTG